MHAYFEELRSWFLIREDLHTRAIADQLKNNHATVLRKLRDLTSRGLLKVIRHAQQKDVDVAYDATEHRDANGETHTTWLKDGCKVPEPICPYNEKLF
jgi:sulfur transfer complex TusBCD TusB component (DsrH family)